jgi:hypothetical protein
MQKKGSAATEPRPSSCNKLKEDPENKKLIGKSTTILLFYFSLIPIFSLWSLAIGG